MEKVVLGPGAKCCGGECGLCVDTPMPLPVEIDDEFELEELDEEEEDD